MFASIKRLTKNSAIYGIGHIFARSIAFFLLPIYTNFLAPEDFGIAVLLISILAIFNIFYVYGMDSAFLRYYIAAENVYEKHKIFNTALWTIFSTALLFSSIGYLLSENVAEILFSDQKIASLLKICCGILFFDAIAAILYLVLRAEEKSLHFVSLKSMAAIIALALNWLFIIAWECGIQGIFWANLISSSASVILILPFIFKKFALGYSFTSLKMLLKFGLPYIPSTLAVILMDVIDRFFIENMLGKGAVGLYGAGYRLGMFMALFVAAFRFAWHPFFLATAKDENAKGIFAKILTYFLLACAIVYLSIAYLIDDLVRLQLGSYHVFGEAYWQSTVVVPVVMLAYILYGIYVNFVVGIHLEKKTHYLPFITGAGAVANIAGNFLLIPLFGMSGAAWATVLGYFVMAITLYIVSQRLYPVRYEFLRIIKLTVIVVLYLANLLYFDWHLAIRVFFIFSFPFALLAIGFFDRKEISFIKVKLQQGFAALPLK